MVACDGCRAALELEPGSEYMPKGGSWMCGAGVGNDIHLCSACSKRVMDMLHGIHDSAWDGLGDEV